MKRYVNKCWLENQVKRISWKLRQEHHPPKERQQMQAMRIYYLQKLVEIDEYHLLYIEI